MSAMRLHHCKAIGCQHLIEEPLDFCTTCSQERENRVESLSERYPNEYRELGDLAEIDTRAVLNLFEIPDHSGLLQQASHTLLMTGTSDTLHRDVRHVGDLIKRWLQLNPEN